MLGFRVTPHQVYVNLSAVGVVISQGRMNLMELKKAVICSNLLREQSFLTPARNRAHQNTCAGDMWTAVLDARGAGDQASDFNLICHNAHTHNKLVDSIRPVNSAMSSAPGAQHSEAVVLPQVVNLDDGFRHDYGTKGLRDHGQRDDSES